MIKKSILHLLAGCQVLSVYAADEFASSMWQNPHLTRKIEIGDQDQVRGNNKSPQESRIILPGYASSYSRPAVRSYPRTPLPSPAYPTYHYSTDLHPAGNCYRQSRLRAPEEIYPQLPIQPSTEISLAYPPLHGRVSHCAQSGAHSIQDHLYRPGLLSGSFYDDSTSYLSFSPKDNPEEMQKFTTVGSRAYFRSSLSFPPHGRQSNALKIASNSSTDGQATWRASAAKHRGLAPLCMPPFSRSSMENSQAVYADWWDEEEEGSEYHALARELFAPLENSNAFQAALLPAASQYPGNPPAKRHCFKDKCSPWEDSYGEKVQQPQTDNPYQSSLLWGPDELETNPEMRTTTFHHLCSPLSPSMVSDAPQFPSRLPHGDVWISSQALIESDLAPAKGHSHAAGRAKSTKQRNQSPVELAYTTMPSTSTLTNSNRGDDLLAALKRRYQEDEEMLRPLKELEAYIRVNNDPATIRMLIDAYEIAESLGRVRLYVKYILEPLPSWADPLGSVDRKRLSSEFLGYIDLLKRRRDLLPRRYNIRELLKDIEKLRSDCQALNYELGGALDPLTQQAYAEKQELDHINKIIAQFKRQKKFGDV